MTENPSFGTRQKQFIAFVCINCDCEEHSSEQLPVINNCSVKGTIINSAQSWSESGGITGYVCQGLIMNCMADVVIEGTSSSNYVEAGGIAGLGGYSALYNNYAKGSIHATAGVNSASIGGIVGMNGGTVVNNTADVELISTRSSIDIGGITGRNTGIALIADHISTVA